MCHFVTSYINITFYTKGAYKVALNKVVLNDYLTRQ